MTGAAQLLGRTGVPSPLGGSSCPGLSRASTRIGLALHVHARAVGATWMAGTSPAMTSREVAPKDPSRRRLISAAKALPAEANGARAAAGKAISPTRATEAAQ